jgi:glycosyltransferase involved in cell wall biosynthesis
MSMSICYLTGDDPYCPSVRFRVLPYLERFRTDGIHAEKRSLPRVRPARLVSLLRLRRFHTVVLHRIVLRDWELLALRRSVRQLVYDFDDALPQERSLPPARKARLRARLLATASAADRVVAGNAWLAAMVREARRPVLLLPTPVDARRFRPLPARQPNDPPVIGWSGTPGNLEYLAGIAPALRRLAEQLPYLLRVICSGPFHLPGVPIDNRRWTPDREVEDLASADLGIMPLADDPWTRGKCGYKLLLSMSCGLATVASPVGINAEIVVEGRTGYLAATDAEWFEALAGLLQDPDRRARFGRAGRERILEAYSVERCYPRLRDFLSGVEAATAAGQAPQGAPPLAAETVEDPLVRGDLQERHQPVEQQPVA